MFRHLALTGPEHATTAYPFLPEDSGDGGGGATGAGTTGDGNPSAGPAGDSAGEQQTGTQDDGWRDRARTWETRAKADKKRADDLAAEVERLRSASMSDAEKAIAAAKEEGQKLGLAAGVGEAVAARLEAALAHLPDPQRDALIDSVSRDRFVGADGKPDRAAIKAWAAQVAPKATARDSFPALGQGQRTPTQTTDMNALIRRHAGF